ncbi:NAD(P)/FAD-dependent oxidoreductase [Loigolactobacillus jiayinensis]|uniref:Ferredoxin--NADP reductase n=1 Tax=Loigolactobacillus jiayinensis TaxID=2486016 RepID=A0ABW1RE07_9LACO|nr:NAD(P)/FAD-dependent oxidoreductase [Loigolactobacillus jiayinensis]
MQHDTHLYDLTVIGGGPIGMFAAFYAGLRELDTQLIESLPQLGGQVAALYPEKIIRDVAGFPHIKGRELVHSLQEQMLQFTDFKPQVFCDEEVLSLEKQGTEFVLTTTKRVTHTRQIIVAIGGGAFSPRPLAVKYDPKLDGKEVFYFVKNVADFTGKTVAIAGGGDSAIDWALTLEKVAQKVYLIHRRPRFRGLEANVKRLEASNVDLVTPFNLSELTKQPAGLELQLKQAKGTEQQRLTVDALLVNYGFTADNHVLRDWGLPLEHRALPVDQNMATSIPGIYGIGDTVTYAGKTKLIAAGFGEAPTAINHIAETLYPERKQPLHSTSIA